MPGEERVIFKSPQAYYQAEHANISKDGKKALIKACIDNAQEILFKGPDGNVIPPNANLFPIYEAIKENLQFVMSAIGKGDPDLTQLHENWLSASEKEWAHFRAPSPSGSEPRASSSSKEDIAEKKGSQGESRPSATQTPAVLQTQGSHDEQFFDAVENFPANEQRPSSTATTSDSLPVQVLPGDVSRNNRTSHASAYGIDPHIRSQFDEEISNFMKKMSSADQA